MPAKYGDRFRNTPTTPLREVIDLGEIGDHSSQPDDQAGDSPAEWSPSGRAWHESWSARLALVAALVVGVVAGGFGLDRWRSYEATVAARSAVDLFASVSTMEYSDADKISIGVRYRNDGEHDLKIRDVRLDTNRAVLIEDPEPLSIEPGQTEAHILALRAECDEGRASGESPPLDIEVETVDGTVRHEVIDIGLASELVGWLSYTCESLAYRPSFAETHAEVVSVTPSEDASVIAEIFFAADESEEVTVDSIETNTAAFALEYILGHPSSGGDFPPIITLVVRVNDCAVALEATERDMTLVINGSYAGSTPGNLTVAPTAALAAELIRLAERSCTG
jgi:hypothetical protein